MDALKDLGRFIPQKIKDEPAALFALLSAAAIAVNTYLGYDASWVVNYIILGLGFLGVRQKVTPVAKLEATEEDSDMWVADELGGWDPDKVVDID